MSDYAIVKTGGKQYRISPGDTIDVEKLPVDEGSRVELGEVFLTSLGDKVTVGRPMVEGAKVVATVTANGKGKKLIIFKYKRKVRYRRRTGHRQPYTRLTIEEIITPDGTAKVEVKPKKAAKPSRAEAPKAEKAIVSPAIKAEGVEEVQPKKAAKPRKAKAPKVEEAIVTPVGGVEEIAEVKPAEVEKPMAKPKKAPKAKPASKRVMRRPQARKTRKAQPTKRQPKKKKEQGD